MYREFTDDELNTYARQIVLADIGYEGQLKLRNATACIVGLGGLGSLIAQKLAGMGIGKLRLVDRDIVSRSDLHRQYLYDVNSVGRPKVEAALQKLGGVNPDVELIAHPETLMSHNAAEIIAGADVVLDGLDRPEPRYIVNRTCNRLNIPYIYGAAIETYGNVSSFVPGKSACLECFMSGLRDEDLPKCGVVGVHPSILGMVTAVQVYEAVSLLVGKEPRLLNKLLFMDLRQMTFEIVNLSTREDCPICGEDLPKTAPALTEKFIEEACARDGRRNVIISPREKIDIDLKHLHSLLSKNRFVINSSGAFGITFEPTPGITVCILKSGVMIAQIPAQLSGYQTGDLLNTYRFVMIDGLGLPAAIVDENS